MNAQAPSSPSARTPSPLGVMFDLTEEDGRFLVAALDEALRAQGVDGSRFLEAFSRGVPLAEALGIPSSALEVIYARAHQWFSIGRVDRAEPLFRALCAGDGSQADHWVGHGVCLRVLGDPHGAAIALQTAHRLRPDWAIPCFHLAELAALAGDRPGALAWLRSFGTNADETTPAPMVKDARRLTEILTPARANG